MSEANELKSLTQKIGREYGYIVSCLAVELAHAGVKTDDPEKTAQRIIGGSAPRMGPLTTPGPGGSAPRMGPLTTPGPRQCRRASG